MGARKLEHGGTSNGTALTPLSPPIPTVRFPGFRTSMTTIRDWIRRPRRRQPDDDAAEIRYWVDFTCEFDRNPGVQRVTRSLARGLQQLGQQVAYLSWSESDRAPSLCTAKQRRKLSRWDGPIDRGFRRARHPVRGDLRPEHRGWLLVPELTYWRVRGGRVEAWESDPIAMLRRYAHERGMRTAFLFHDLIPLRMPDYPQLRALHERYVEQLAQADLILPVSNYAGSDLTSYLRETLRLDAGAGPSIVPHPLAQEFLGHKRSTAYDAPSVGPIAIMCVSHIEPRKNQIRLLEAFNTFCEEHPKVNVRLSLVGAINDDLRDRVKAVAGHNPRIEVVGHVSDSEMITRYRACHFTVFPSVAEGYGLPIVESLWLGRPCLCADFGAMAEVARDGGCLAVDTRSTLALKNGLESLILNSALRRDLAATAIRRPMRTWRDYAEGLLAVLGQHDAGRVPVDGHR
jgi:glycosyltransferase involved in cell wall biosynthesis